MTELTLPTRPAERRSPKRTHPVIAPYAYRAGLRKTARYAGWFGVYSLATLAEFMQSYGTMVSPDNVTARATHYHDTARFVAGRTAGTVRAWHAQPWSRAKVAAPIVGSLGWANLLFGESIALIGQGIVQQNDPSSVNSFVTHLCIAILIEIGFTYPVAIRNDRRRLAGEHPVTTASDIMQAMATAFWLGGAMGVDEKRLGRRHMFLPIAAYLVFAVLLATVGNYHDLAATVISSPAFYIALIAVGLVKKVNDLTGYKGGFERMAEGTVRAAERLSRQKQSGR